MKEDQCILPREEGERQNKSNDDGEIAGAAVDGSRGGGGDGGGGGDDGGDDGGEGAPRRETPTMEPSSSAPNLTLAQGSPVAAPLSFSDYYDVAPPVYELNTGGSLTVAAAAVVAAEKRRATSGGERGQSDVGGLGGLLEGSSNRMSGAYLNTASIPGVAVMGNRHGSALSFTAGGGGRLGSTVSQSNNNIANNYLSVPGSHQTLYRTRSQELADQVQ